MQDQSYEISVSPSFNSYSSDSLADIATKVCTEFGKLKFDTSGDAPPPDEEDDFEFVSLSTSGDEVFLNGDQISPVFPVFNRDLLLGNCKDQEEEDHPGDRLDLPDGDAEEEEVQDPPSSSSSSSSEADELDGIPPGTYCLWTPKGRVPPSPARCQKSKSTGSSSRRWRFRDLLRRCHSDGKESFVFLTPSFGSRKSTTMSSEKNNKTSKVEEIKPIIGHNRGSVISAASAAGKEKNMAAAHEVFYVKNRASKNQKAEKRRSTFLPYRQDLVGFFSLPT